MYARAGEPRAAAPGGAGRPRGRGPRAGAGGTDPRWRRGGREAAAAPSGARPIHRGCDGPGPARAPPERRQSAGSEPGAALAGQHSDPPGARDRAGRSAGRCRRRGRSGHGHHGEADEGLRVAALLPAAAGSRRPPRGAVAETVSAPRRDSRLPTRVSRVPPGPVRPCPVPWQPAAPAAVPRCCWRLSAPVQTRSNFWGKCVLKVTSAGNEREVQQRCAGFTGWF